MGILNSNVAVGVGAAVVATILAPVLLPVIGTVGRPLAKTMIRGGLMLYERSREAVALAGEIAEDMIAEIRAEDAAQAMAAASAAAAATQAQPAPAQARESAQQPGAARPAAPETGAPQAQAEGVVPMQAVPPAASAGAH